MNTTSNPVEEGFRSKFRETPAEGRDRRGLTPAKVWIKQQPIGYPALLLFLLPFDLHRCPVPSIVGDEPVRVRNMVLSRFGRLAFETLFCSLESRRSTALGMAIAKAESMRQSLAIRIFCATLSGRFGARTTGSRRPTSVIGATDLASPNIRDTVTICKGRTLVPSTL